MYLPSPESSPDPAERPQPLDPAVGPVSPVPGWLIAAAALVLVGVVGVLGLFRPAFFVTPVLDQVSVQDGVGMILVDAYRLPNVAGVTCPADQQVLPGRSFTCVGVVDGKRSEIPVVIQDKAGHYQVGRPAP
ncbi:MAG: DUF4333 domain-containing protein [Pseudonocardia sp.]|nr:DUF4333 domain-containing protein [Pseudonocardia sp.]